MGYSFPKFILIFNVEKAMIAQFTILSQAEKPEFASILTYNLLDNFYLNVKHFTSILYYSLSFSKQIICWANYSNWERKTTGSTSSPSPCLLTT